MDNIYCNPLSLPDYPLGMYSPSRCEGVPPRSVFCGDVCDYRELADPDVLFDDGVWYLYASCAQVYYSSDLVHWKFRPVEIEDGRQLWYAPSIIRYGDSYILTSSHRPGENSMFYTGDSPFGPFHSVGALIDQNSHEITDPEFLDPDLFCDDDGRLYVYWGAVGLEGGGIFGAELNPCRIHQIITEPVKIIDFNPKRVFERLGEYNEHPDCSFIEGASMMKYHGVYFLQYSFCGTVFRNYGIGVYRGNSPLGKFIPQEIPMLLSRYGMISGTGHGCMVQGPDERVWQFYTCLMHQHSSLERRIAMDLVSFDNWHNARVEATGVPQSILGKSCGWLPLSVNKPVECSSFEYYNYPSYANDDCTHTWWSYREDDSSPFLRINLRSVFIIYAVRIIWAEINCHHVVGKPFLPVRFYICFYDGRKRRLAFQIDKLGNSEDMLVETLLCGAVRAQYVEIGLIPELHVHRGITQFTVFGTAEVNM